jgi:adenylyltransferase/sulfurtransferase
MRYERQINIHGFGIEGQKKLKRTRVIIAGIGGLGSSIAIYLAIAGVGNIRIVDNDVVSLSNLNRQILYQTQDIGRKKAWAGKESLLKWNNDIQIEAIMETISVENIHKITEGCDLILDATDNFTTRYLLNEASLVQKIPLLYGGIYGLEGALTTIIPGKTACLKCIFPEVPPLTISPVLGVTAGIIGCLQSMETIKYIVGLDNLLTNRMLIYDGFNMKFREVNLRPDPNCPDCSSHYMR